MYKSLLFTFLLFVAFSSSSQSPDMTQFKNMNMRHIGPGAMSGRVTSIDAVVSDPKIIYVGTASGGLWKSESGGITWTPIFDEQPLQSIGAIAIDQNNPDVIWAGTGEGNPRNSHTSGAGIYKSIDGGQNWKLMGLVETKTIHRIIINTQNPDIVHVGAMGSIWGANKERGVFKTSDGGKTWKNVLFVNDSTGCADLVVDPSNPNKLIAGMWEYGREPWFFNSGGEGSGMYITYDGGDTWEERTEIDGLPKGNLGRMGLAIAASNPKHIYALIESKKTGLYESRDGGFKWKLVSTENIGNRPFYYADIYVNPKNENEIWNLWSMVSKSEDGGKTFKTVMTYSSAHPDHHAFWIHPENPDLMIDGNDGGMNISRDGGNNWEFITNLPLGQFYHISYDMDIPYHVYGGMQDNGSWQGPGYVWHQGGIRNEDWQEINFGDGFDVVSNPDNSRYAYTMSQGGYLTYVDIETGESHYIQPVHPEGEKLRFSWNSAISIDPFNSKGVYFGSQYLHHSTDYGASWNIISPDLSSNDTTKQKQAESGGLTIDVTDAENHTTILCISPSTLDEKTIWVGTDDGNIQLTRNGGKTWQNLIGKIKDAPRGAWIPQIILSEKNEGEAFVVMNDYRRNNWTPYLYHTKDFGNKWVRLANDENVSGHALSFVQDTEVPELMFLGTENGLYVSFDYGQHWNQWENDYPSVSTIDLKIHPREGDLIIGTFGRAAYILDDIEPLRDYARRGDELLNDSLHVFTSPDSYMASFRRPAGARFMAQHNWSGENKRSAAKISYHSLSIEEGGKQKVKFQIVDSKGDTLRTFTVKPDSSGINYVYWHFDSKGVRWPSRRERKKDADEPGGGPRVLPGIYTVFVSTGNHLDSTELFVHADPRKDFNSSYAQSAWDLEIRWGSMMEKADKGFEQTKSAFKTIKLVKSQLVNVPDSLKKDLLDMADSLSTQLTEFQNLYMHPEGTKGYQDGSDLLSRYLWSSSAYIEGGTWQTGGNGMNALATAEKKVDEVVSQINVFFEEQWIPWQEEVEKMEYSLFDEVEKIE